MLRRCAPAGKETTITVVDLDRVKEINDIHCRNAGDILLQTVASRMKTLTGPSELVVRVGGDEFIAVKQDITSKEEIEHFVIRLISGVLDPIQNKSKRCPSAPASASDPASYKLYRPADRRR